MPVFKPFKAIRPLPEYASRTLCPPYDVVDRKQVAEMCRDPLSFMNVIRSDALLPEDRQYSAEAYELAKKNLLKYLEDGIMFSDNAPSYYIYSQTMDGNTRTGIVGCASVDDYMNGSIKKHEITRTEKEQDRISHFDACSAHTEPLFLMYKKNKKISDITDRLTSSREPDYISADSSNVVHRMWVVDSENDVYALEGAFAAMPVFYIADGHHRTASAAGVSKIRRSSGPYPTGDEEFNRFMAAAFPADELTVMPYNRVIKDLNGMTPDGFIKKLSGIAEVDEAPSGTPEVKGVICLYLDKKWYRITFHRDKLSDSSPVSSLDVTALQELVIEPLLNITDIRTDTRIAFSGGTGSIREMTDLVDSGEMAAAFSMYPVSTDEIMKIADAGMVMPPKSTWFEPKLGSGWFVHSF